MALTPITGSYDPTDCLFLLKPIAPPDTAVADKEHLIQSGQRHYSELLSHEHPASPEYLTLFEQLTDRCKTRLAQDVLDLADHLRRTRPAPLTLVSLARAGTPIGALLKRALAQLGVTDAVHYSLSIIRDRGIDSNALKYILRVAQRPAAGVVFIDGWTAKGVITGELKTAIARWNASEPERLADDLCVIADIGGVADVAATFDDYLIPSGILGALVSGLVSRSILNDAIGPDDFHGCVMYDELHAQDRSRWFLETVSAAGVGLTPRPLPLGATAARREATAAYLEAVRQEYRITDINHIKPGVLEASRVMLRRLPGLLLLRDAACADVAHLQLLAAEKQVRVAYDPAMPFNATCLIKDLRLQR